MALSALPTSAVEAEPANSAGVPSTAYPITGSILEMDVHGRLLIDGIDSAEVIPPSGSEFQVADSHTLGDCSATNSSQCGCHVNQVSGYGGTPTPRPTPYLA